MVSNVVVVVVVVADVAGAAATALRVDNATVTALGGGGEVEALSVRFIV